MKLFCIGLELITENSFKEGSFHIYSLLSIMEAICDAANGYHWKQSKKC